MEDPGRGRKTEDFKVIFVFGDRKDTFSPPILTMALVIMLALLLVQVVLKGCA